MKNSKLRFVVIPIYIGFKTRRFFGGKMRRTLKKDINQYDDKMIVQTDLPTLRAGLLALAVAVIAYLLLSKVCSILVALPVSASVFLLIFIYRIATFNGVPLRQYMREFFNMMIDPYATEKPYQMTEENRLFLNQNKKEKTE